MKIIVGGGAMLCTLAHTGFPSARCNSRPWHDFLTAPDVANEFPDRRGEAAIYAVQ
jgi:hypothetical protein